MTPPSSRERPQSHRGFPWAFRAAALFLPLWWTNIGVLHAATDARIVERYRQMIAANPADESALDRLWKIARQDGFADDLLAQYGRPAAKDDFARQLILAGLLHRAGRDDESRQAFSRAAKLDPKSPLPHLMPARFLPAPEAAAELEKVIALVEKAGVQGPKDAPALPNLLQQLAETRVAAGEPEKAAEAWERAVKLEPDSLEPRRRLAAYYLEKGDGVSAAAHLAWLERHGDIPTRVNALRSLARLHQASGAFDPALEALGKALALTSADNWLRAELVAETIRVSRRANRLPQLETRWKKDAEANSHAPGPWLQLADLYNQQGNSAGERAALEKAIALIPGDSALRIRLGRLLVRMDDLPAAAVQLDAALAAATTTGRANADLVFERAELDIRRGDPGAARTRIDALPSPAANDPLAGRIVEFFRRNRMFDAIEQRLRKPGADPPALADFLFAQNRREEARAALRKLIRSEDPPKTQAEAHEHVAELLKQAGETVAALAELREAARLQPDIRRIQLVLGDAILAAGEPKLAPGTAGKSAREAYEKAVALSRTEEDRTEADQRIFRSFERETPVPVDLSGSTSEAPGVTAELAAVPDDGAPASSTNRALAAFIETLEARAMKSSGPDGASAWLRLARWQFWNHDPETAQAAAREAVALAPTLPAPHELAVTIDLATGDRNGAIGQLRQLAQAMPERKDRYLRQIAHIQMQMGRRAEALKILEEIAMGQNPEALAELADAQQQAGRWNDALAAWERLYATAKKERRHQYLSQLVHAMEHQQLHQRAAEIVWKEFTEDAGAPARPEVLRTLIAHCRDHGLTKWLLEKLQTRAALSGDSTDALALAEALKADGRFAEAGRQLEGAARSAPDPASAEADLVREAEGRRDFIEAAAHQRLRLNMIEAPPVAEWEKLALLHEQALDYPGADSVRDDIVRRFPRDSDALLACARHFVKWGRADRAIEIVRAVRGFDPVNVRAAAALNRLLSGVSPATDAIQKEATEAAETVLAKTPGGIASDSIILPPMPAPSASRVQAYLATFAAAGDGVGGTVSLFDEHAAGDSEREWRLEAIRRLAGRLDEGEAPISETTERDAGGTGMEARYCSDKQRFRNLVGLCWSRQRLGVRQSCAAFGCRTTAPSPQSMLAATSQGTLFLMADPDTPWPHTGGKINSERMVSACLGLGGQASRKATRETDAPFQGGTGLPHSKTLARFSELPTQSHAGLLQYCYPNSIGMEARALLRIAAVTTGGARASSPRQPPSCPRSESRQRWIVQWQDAPAASERLWALYYCGARREAFAFLASLAARSPANANRRFALVWCALRSGAWKELGDWLWRPERTPEDHETFLAALGEWCGMGAEGQIDSDLPQARQDADSLDLLFAKAAPAQLWPCARVFANHHRYSQAIALGRRAFDRLPAPRAAEALVLAQTLLAGGDVAEACKLLQIAANEPADSPDAPPYAALRALFLLAPEKERAAWVEKTIAEMNPASPAHSALASALLCALSGNAAACHSALDRLIALRFAPVGESPSAERAWTFLLAAGMQLQLWNLNDAASFLWRHATNDEVAARLQGERAAALAGEARLRGNAIELAGTKRSESAQRLAGIAAPMPITELVRLAGYLLEQHYPAVAVRVLVEAQKSDVKAPLPRLLEACAASGDKASAESAIDRWLAVAPEDIPSAQAALDFLCVFDTDRAAEFAGKILAQTPVDPRILEPLARLQRKLKQWDAAEDTMRKLVGDQPGNIQWRLELADLHAVSGKPKAALDILAAAPRCLPELNAKTAECLAAKGDLVEARIAAAEVLAERAMLPAVAAGENVDGSVFQRIATAFDARGDKADALAVLAAAVESACRARQPRAAFMLQGQLLRLLGPADPAKPEPAIASVPTAPAQLRTRWLTQWKSLAVGRPEFLSAYYELTADPHWLSPDQRKAELAADWEDGRGMPVAGAWLVADMVEGRQTSAPDAILPLLLARRDVPDSLLTWLDDRCKRANRLATGFEVTKALLRRSPVEPEYVIRHVRNFSEEHFRHKGARRADAEALLRHAALCSVFTPDAAGRLGLAALDCATPVLARTLLESAARADPAAQQTAVYFACVRLLLDADDCRGAEEVLAHAYRNPAARAAQPIIDYLRRSVRPLAEELRDLDLPEDIAREVQERLRK